MYGESFCLGDYGSEREPDKTRNAKAGNRKGQRQPVVTYIRSSSQTQFHFIPESF